MGGRDRDCSQRKQLTQVWGVRLPGGCLTSTSGGPRCPRAAGDPRRDLPSRHGKELGTVSPRPGPCIPHPDPCIPHLGSLHPGPHIHPCIPHPSLHIPHLASQVPASRVPATYTLHPASAWRTAGCAATGTKKKKKKSLEQRFTKRFADGSQGPGEGGAGGLRLSLLWRGGRVQGDPGAPQLDGGRWP